MSRIERYRFEEMSRERYPLIAPTGGAIDISLSLRTTMRRVSIEPALFRPSYAMPPVSAPSPMTATTRFLRPCKSRETANPSADEMEVEAWAAPKGSYSLSERLVKPDSPPP